jgi:hypothetical protein
VTSETHNSTQPGHSEEHDSGTSSSAILPDTQAIVHVEQETIVLEDEQEDFEHALKGV